MRRISILAQTLAVGTAFLATQTGTEAVRAAQPKLPAPRCYTSQLSITPERSSAAAGHVGLMFRARNQSSRSCSLYGYPGVQLLDRSGRALPTSVVWGPGYLAGLQPRRLVLLAPSGNAFFTLEWTHIPAPGQTCPHARFLRIIPPNAYHPVLVALGRSTIDACGGRVTASPVEPSRFRF